MAKDNPTTNAFIKALRELRQMRRLNQMQLAEHTGLKPSAISHFENGRRSPSLDNLVRLADALGVTTDRLLGREAEKLSNSYPTDRLTSEIVRTCDLLSTHDLRLLADVARSFAEKTRPTSAT
jgi:transcriptional regulator with XRE-family HTH domain